MYQTPLVEISEHISLVSRYNVSGGVEQSNNYNMGGFYHGLSPISANVAIKTLEEWMMFII